MDSENSNSAFVVANEMMKNYENEEVRDIKQTIESTNTDAGGVQSEFDSSKQVLSSGAGTEDTSDIITLEDLIGDMSHLKIKTGVIPVRGKGIKYWCYKNPNQPLGERPPVLALHGGPAFTHSYMLPLILLADFGMNLSLIFQAKIPKLVCLRLSSNLL